MLESFEAGVDDLDFGANRIFGNTDADVIVDNATVNARGNWWGIPGGPAAGRVAPETEGRLAADPGP